MNGADRAMLSRLRKKDKKKLTAEQRSKLEQLERKAKRPPAIARQETGASHDHGSSGASGGLQPKTVEPEQLDLEAAGTWSPAGEAAAPPAPIPTSDTPPPGPAETPPAPSSPEAAPPALAAERPPPPPPTAEQIAAAAAALENGAETVAGILTGLVRLSMHQAVRLLDAAKVPAQVAPVLEPLRRQEAQEQVAKVYHSAAKALALRYGGNVLVQMDLAVFCSISAAAVAVQLKARELPAEAPPAAPAA